MALEKPLSLSRRVAEVPPSDTSPAASTKSPGNEVERRGLRERTLGTRLEKHHGLDFTLRRHFGCESDRLPILTVLDKVPGC